MRNLEEGPLPDRDLTIRFHSGTTEEGRGELRGHLLDEEHAGRERVLLTAICRTLHVEDELGLEDAS